MQLPRSENFWQAGPTGVRPCTELYLDRGEEFGGVDDRPGDDTDRFIEFWNHVFMTYDLSEDGGLSPLPQNNVDTGMGVERMAAILQDVPSVFETDGMWPLVELAEDLSGRTYSDGGATTRAMRILADHPRHRRTDRRRSGAVERGPRLRAAADHAQGHPAGPRDRSGKSVHGEVRRAGAGAAGARLPRAGGRARDRAAVGARRGELRAPSTAAAICSRT